MSTFTNTAREVEMPNGDVVVIHNAPTGGANTTSNIKKFKYDDNGHVTESTAADAEDLNLDSYSTPTTGTTAIGTSDSVQTAIGKLDHQSQIDQTNILYTLNRTGKNCVDLQNPYIVRANQGQQTYTNGDNGSVTLTDTNTKWSTYQVVGYVKPNTQYKVVTYASNFTNNISLFVKESLTSETNLGNDAITGNGMFLMNITTGSSDRIRICYNLNNSDTAKSNSITLRTMLVEASTYAIDSSYVVAALPNSDLTYLEAEDRAELIELVDSGAKNKLQNNATSNTIKGVTFTVNSDGSISTYGTSNAGDCIFYINQSFKFESGVRYVLTGCPSGGSSDGYRLCNMGATYINDFGYGGEVTGDGSTREIAIYIKNSGTNMGTAQSPKKFYPMICTKAAFGVSQKFVPYRPNYDTLISTINAKAPALATAAMNSGSLDDITTNSFIVCNANVSSKPIATMGYVRTSVFDANSALQEFYSFSANEAQSRLVYVRDKQDGVWRSWKLLTNT